MNRKLLISAMLVLLLVLSVACGQKPETSSQNGNITTDSSNGNTNNTQGSQGASNEGSQSLKKQTIDTYYTDDQMLELTKASKEITYKEDQDKYAEALKTLQSSDDSKLFPLWGKVTFNSAKLDNRVLTVDITLPDEARLGAGGEALAMDALKNTLFQFPEVNSIELLVDGKQVDTLMGHVELEHPITRK